MLTVKIAGAIMICSKTKKIAEDTHKRFEAVSRILICWNLSDSSKRPTPAVAPIISRSVRLMLAVIGKYSPRIEQRTIPRGMNRAGMSQRKTLRIVIAWLPRCIGRSLGMRGRSEAVLFRRSLSRCRVAMAGMKHARPACFFSLTYGETASRSVSGSLSKRNPFSL